MVKLTKNGICHDLKSSPYTFTCGDTNTKYFFSSQLHLNKFVENYANNRIDTCAVLTSKLKFTFKGNEISDLILYSKIENRGFYFIRNGVEYKWREIITLNGEIATPQN